MEDAPSDWPCVYLQAGDLRRAAAALPGVFCLHPAPLFAAPGTVVLALSDHSTALTVLARRDHAGGFSLAGEASAHTPHRPGLHLRAFSDPDEPWTRTLARATRLTRQLDVWLTTEWGKDEGARDLDALIRVRRGTQPGAEVLGVEVAWSDALGCWSCLDRQTGEVIRLEAHPRTLAVLLRAGRAALSLAGQAWAYSVADHRTAIAVCVEDGQVRARRVRAWSEGVLVAYRAGVQVFTRR